jgi:predicted permease
MRWSRTLWLKLRCALRRERLESDLDEELRFHLEMKAQQLARRGVAPEEAGYQARREFGNAAVFKDTSRDIFGFRVLEQFLQDVRYALRALGRAPGFTFAAVAVLALGLGANTAIFSVVNAVLLRPLPYPHPDELVMLYEQGLLERGGNFPVSPRNFLDWQQEARSFQSMAASTFAGGNLSGTGYPAEVVAGRAFTGSIGSVLGVPPAAGRWITPADDRPEAPPAMMLSYRLWQRRFGGSYAVIGKAVQLDKMSFTVVGVLPRVFVRAGEADDILVPLQRLWPPAEMQRRGSHSLLVDARLKAGVSVMQARAEMNGIAARIKQAHPKELTGKSAAVVSLHEREVLDYRSSLLTIFGAVGCVLLIACLNVGGLLVARVSARRRELAVRAALGAGRGRILRQLLVEAMALASGGALVGLALAYSLGGLLLAEAPGVETWSFELDWRVLLFAAVLTLATTALMGIIPAWQVRRLDLAGAMKQGDPSRSAGSRGRLREILVASELALSLVLLAGAGLLLRSFTQLRGVNPGLRSDHLLVVGFQLPDKGYDTAVRAAAFHEELLRRVRAMPGAVAAGMVSNLPLMGHWSDKIFEIEGRPPVPLEQSPDAVDLWCDPAYLRTAGIPILAGRAFTPDDGRAKEVSATIVSRATAQKYWPGESPLGQYMRIHERRYQVVGVAGDVLSWLGQPAEPTMYFPMADTSSSGAAYLLVRTGGLPLTLAPVVRRIMTELDRDLALHPVMAFDDLIGERAGEQRYETLLLGSFAFVALLLAAIGLYGVMSYIVVQRTSEIGVRVALGASRGDVLTLLLQRGMQPVAAGIVLGLAAAFASTRLIRGMLYATDPGDPLTFALVAAVLAIVAVAACTMPALGATRIDPVRALRNE